MRPPVWPLLLLLGAAACSSPAERPTFIDLRDDAPERLDPRARQNNPQARMDELMEKMESGEMPKIQFEFDSAEILPASFTTLDAVAGILLENPKLKLMVRAHTCTIGSDDYNLDLSGRRAKAVTRYLARKGVPPPSMRHRGMGYHVPIADNSTPAGREMNRRVEFRVTFRDWESVY